MGIMDWVKTGSDILLGTKLSGKSGVNLTNSEKQAVIYGKNTNMFNYTGLLSYTDRKNIYNYIYNNCSHIIKMSEHGSNIKRVLNIISDNDESKKNLKYSDIRSQLPDNVKKVLDEATASVKKLS